MCVGSRAVAGGSLQEWLSVRHLGLDHAQTGSGPQLIILFPASGLTCRICEESKRERCGAGVFRSPFWTILIFFNDFCRV